MHRLQDAVYLDANTNGVKGLSLKTDYTYFFNSILSKTTTGEVSDAAQKMGMKTHPLMGNKRDDLYNHKEAVQDFFQEHPKGSIILGVSMNEETGELRPVSEEHKINHAVTVYQREGTFYLLDTGASDNGLKNSRRTLNAAEIESFIYTHRAKSFGVTLP